MIKSLRKQSLKNSNLLILVLALANASVVVGMGLITPSITIIKADFNLTSDMVQLTLTVFIIAAGIGQLVFGFFLQKWHWGLLNRLKMLPQSPLRFSTIGKPMLRTFKILTFLTTYLKTWE